jgi:serine/threonine-protein kinase
MPNVGPYEVVSRLAAGGMAEVFLVLERAAGRAPVPFALKRIRPEAANDPDVHKMLTDEANLSQRLMHRGIARTVKAEHVDGQLYLVMEFVDGRDFGRVLARERELNERIRPELAALVVLRAAEALDYAHRLKDKDGRPMNIVHRDVSPSNIMVSFQGEVRLIDFGIARAERRLTATHTGIIKGKYRYMAPEQALGKPIDHRADVYSMGVVLYEALAGMRPLPELSDMELLVAVSRSQIPPLRAIERTAPPGLARITMRCMDADLNARYATAADLASDLRAWLTQNLPRALTPSDLEAFMARLFPTERSEIAQLLARAG